MAKTLKEILIPEVIDECVRTIHKNVHWLEYVDGDPAMIRTACKRFSWNNWSKLVLDVSRAAVNPVTCPECLAAITDKPIIVVVT